MPVVIESPRFGRVEIDPSTVIEFPDGLIGLGGSRYALLAGDADSAFQWLHCVDQPKWSLPVVNPHRFFSAFAVALTDQDADRLGLDGESPYDVYVTVRSAPVLDQFTANLKAPILIRAGRGLQVINQALGCELQAALFAEVLAAAAGSASGTVPARAASATPAC